MIDTTNKEELMIKIINDILETRKEIKNKL